MHSREGIFQFIEAELSLLLRFICEALLVLSTLSHRLRYPWYREPDNFDQFINFPNFYANQSTAQIDEYEAYKRIPAHECKEPLRWSTKREEWPRLWRIAVGLLSILLMGSECERVFSTAGYILTGRRNHMKEDIIEALTCLRGWQNTQHHEK